MRHLKRLFVTLLILGCACTAYLLLTPAETIAEQKAVVLTTVEDTCNKALDKLIENPETVALFVTYFFIFFLIVLFIAAIVMEENSGDSEYFRPNDTVIERIYQTIWLIIKRLFESVFILVRVIICIALIFVGITPD